MNYMVTALADAGWQMIVHANRVEFVVPGTLRRVIWYNGDIYVFNCRIPAGMLDAFFIAGRQAMKGNER